MRNRTHALALAFAGAAALLVLFLLPYESSSEDLTSASFVLRGGTLSGGGEAALQSTAPVPTIGSAGVTIGQTGPIGVSTGSTSGITLHAGFWPIVAGPAGILDSDSDGIPDVLDNCVDLANGPLSGPPGCYAGSQMDTDGDGYGDPCDGDFPSIGSPSGDGVINATDTSYFVKALMGTGPTAGADMNCDSVINATDVSMYVAQLGQGFPGP